MMPDLMGFLAVVMIAYVIPGPDFFVILQSTASGKRVGLWTAMGAQSGLTVHMVLAVLGLTALVAQSAVAFSVVKAAGAVYLIWLGLRIIWSSRRTGVRPRRGKETRRDAPVTGRLDGYLRGLLTNVLNPKAVVFFLSVLPQFVDTTAPAAAQILLLGVVDIVVGVLWWFALVLLMRQLVGFLQRPTVRTWWDRVTGSLLASAGGVLAYSAATSRAV